MSNGERLRNPEVRVRERMHANVLKYFRNPMRILVNVGLFWIIYHLGLATDGASRSDRGDDAGA